MTRSIARAVGAVPRMLVLACLLLLVLLGPVLLRQSNHFSFDHTARIYGTGLLLGAACFISGAVVLYGSWLYGNRSKCSFYDLAVLGSGTLVWLGCSLLVNVVRPSNSSFADTETVHNVVPGNGPEMRFTVFFGNGSSKLDSAQGAKLQALFHALTQCPGAKVGIRGFASSAEYHPETEKNNNLYLANTRGMATAAFATREHLTVEPYPPDWPTLQDMIDHRAITDQSPDQKRLVERELLNRRAVVDINLGSCGVQ
jgi:hypothetical protein